MIQSYNMTEFKKTEKFFRDVPISDLVPMHTRVVGERMHRRLTASIKDQGLIEPIIVYPEDGRYVILDGLLRYRILLELGVGVVPCIVHNQKESFTANRMVNRLSPVQENRMIEKALTELDEKMIAKALGVTHISFRENKSLLEQLHPEVTILLDKSILSQSCAKDITYVTKSRQAQIARAMHKHDDFSAAFARTLILKTPAKQRACKRRTKHTPWNLSLKKKESLLEKLQKTEKKYDFYSRLYRNYSSDMMKLVIYVRSLITNETVHEYLKEHHPEILQQYTEIIFEGKDSK